MKYLQEEINENSSGLRSRQAKTWESDCYTTSILSSEDEIDGKEHGFSISSFLSEKTKPVKEQLQLVYFEKSFAS